MKEKFVLTHRDTVTEETEKKAWRIINRPALKHVVFTEI